MPEQIFKGDNRKIVNQFLLNHMSTTSTSQNECQTLPADQMEILGRVYKNSEIYLLRADYHDAQITGKFRWFTPTCYKNEPTHLTRIQIVSYVGQLSYLFGVLMARNGLLPISEQDYVKLIEADKATFMELNLRFRQFIRPTSEVEIKIACRRNANGEPIVKQVRNLVVAPLLIDVANGACTGESEAVVILE
jgi:hypothetical protein